MAGSDDLDDPRLVRLTRGARYETLTCLAEDNLAAGMNAIMVAPFTIERRDPRAWGELERRLSVVGASAIMVWLRISFDDVCRRVELRGADRDLAKRSGDGQANLDLDPPAVPHIEIDALLRPETIAETILSSLGDQPTR
jgi:hypothetical protein